MLQVKKSDTSSGYAYLTQGHTWGDDPHRDPEAVFPEYAQCTVCGMRERIKSMGTPKAKGQCVPQWRDAANIYGLVEAIESGDTSPPWEWHNAG